LEASDFFFDFDSPPQISKEGTSLSLSDKKLNKREKLPDLGKHLNLHKLDVRNAQLATIEWILPASQTLTRLDLSGNEGITDWSPLANLTGLHGEKNLSARTFFSRTS
jgi:Leucine-rich repeat (LRR) protein